MAQHKDSSGRPPGPRGIEGLETVVHALAGHGEAPANAAPDAADTPLAGRVHAIDPALLPQLLEALPAGLALLAGHDLAVANSAFALAFGYGGVEALKRAGGLAAVFPDGPVALAALLDAGGNGSTARATLQARTQSGRSIAMPVAVHPLMAEPDGAAPMRLLVLHPEPGAGAEQEPLDADSTRKRPRRKTGGKDNRKRKQKKLHRPELDFLAKVSHEVRTPLNSIIGFAELMKEERLGPVGNDRYRTYIGDIYDSGLYALSLINDLLDISKIEAGKFDLDFTALDVHDVIVECVNLMQPQVQRQRVVLRMALEDDIPEVLADRRSVKQILLNLLSNAVKFTNAGGQVIVSTRRTSSGGVGVRVQDTGIGMSEREVAQAMKPFRQLDTAPRKQIGTGLGLPLTKGLVEANRAKFKLKSGAKAGTRIDVIFPANRLAGRV